MQYVISWRERAAASSQDYEAAHRRIRELFNAQDWKFPPSFTIHQFVVRAGDYGGYMVVDTDSGTDIH